MIFVCEHFLHVYNEFVIIWLIFQFFHVVFVISFTSMVIMNALKEIDKTSEFEEEIVRLIIFQVVFSFHRVQSNLILVFHDIYSEVFLLYWVTQLTELLISIAEFVGHKIKIRVFYSLNLCFYDFPGIFEILNIFRKAMFPKDILLSN